MAQQFANFALPIGHDPINVSNVGFTLGLPFRQPVDLPDKDNFSIGLDLWFKDSDNKKIYSMFDVLVEYYPQSYILKPSYQNSLILTILDTTSSFLKKIPKMNEPSPIRIVYNNVNTIKVKESLVNLINDSYLHNPNHPILKSIYKDNKTIKDYLTSLPNHVIVIGELVDEFLSETNFKLFINAGDEIGEAGTKTPPAGMPFETHNINIFFELYDDSVLNPKYYLWQFLKDSIDFPDKRIKCLTKTGYNPPPVGDTGFSHSLLSQPRLNIKLNTPELPRIFVSRLDINNGVDTILFPVGNLGQWHGYETGNEESKLLWRIVNDNNLIYEVKLRGVTNTYGNKIIRLANDTNYNSLQNIIDVSPDPNDIKNTVFYGNANFNQRVSDIWTAWADDINSLCYLLQFPAEYIISNIYQESYNQPRRLRLEPLRSNNTVTNYEKIASKNGASNELINSYKNICPNYGNGFDKQVPEEPLNRDSLVDSDHAITWGELINMMSYVPGRMSPGLLQTLISTANDRIEDIKKVYGNNSNEMFGVSSYPANNDYEAIFDWLLNGRCSILLSICYHKKMYQSRFSKLDMPLVFSRYNSGASRGNNPWLLAFNGTDYPLFTSKYYNSVRNNSQINLNASFYKSF